MTGESLHDSREPEPTPNPGIDAQKRKTILTGIVASAVFGVVYGAVPGDTILDYVVIASFMFVTWTLIIQWCLLDAQQYNVQLSRGFKIAAIIIPGPLVTIPCYLLYTRRLRGLFSCALFYALVAVVWLLNELAVKVGFATVS